MAKTKKLTQAQIESMSITEVIQDAFERELKTVFATGYIMEEMISEAIFDCLTHADLVKKVKPIVNNAMDELLADPNFVKKIVIKKLAS